MSALAEKIGTKLLVKFACGIASAAGEKAFAKGFEEFFGSDEKELENNIKAEIADVKKELKEAINQIRDVKKSIDNLSSQLADSILNLRSDSLKGHLTRIDSLYNSIIDIFETVVRDSEIADLEKRQLRMRELQKRMDNRLKEVAKNVPESLEHINSFLGEEGNSSFLKQLAQRAFDNSDEFRIFYLRCRALVYSYWAVVGRGIELLEMATRAPKVHFSEGEKTTARHLGYLEKQQELFEASVGKATIDLYNSLMELEGEVKLPVWFATSSGSGIATSKYIAGVSVHEIGWAIDPWQKWYLIPVSGRESLESFSGSAYWLQEIETTDYLAGLTIRDGQSTIRYATKGRRLRDVQWNWFIKPLAPGSDRFTIRQEESPGWVISVGEGTRNLEMWHTLPSPRAEGFQILPLGDK
ncbi:hypothetical protein NW752_007572 [Fusarium irregulare]|uniref:Uncharacterized protein n=1 Tax=Fusarium irregulare TaxID=2494466 RepID=A0A9W8PK07_9HYPO|nr:hypothetical protein NW766_010132 [Fusarium irregulare]KAJ4013276.1 hypothetical protein NW752_007572 [Fusarium irregulare]